MLSLTSAAAVSPLSSFAGAAAQTPALGTTHARETILAYLDQTVPQLLRPPAGHFRFPSLAPSLPGREYAASLWDWDTLWTCRGLFAYTRACPDRLTSATCLEHAEGSLKNFFEHQSSEGKLPILMTDRDPDLLRTTAPNAPPHANQAKPVFAQLALLIAQNGAGFRWLEPYFDKLLRFYASWEKNNLDRSGLFVWGDDVAIGNDNDPTTFGRPFFSSANLLLNCLFQADLTAAAAIADQLGRSQDATVLRGKAAALAQAVRNLCWDSRDRFFYTVDVQCRDRRSDLLPQIKPGMAMSWQTLPLRLQTFTGFLPLWCGIATPDQATQLIAANYLADDRLRCAFGVRSLSRLESMYSLDFSSNPSNWLGPVWIIANFFVWSGLRRYGFRQQARELADKTLQLLANDIARNGSMNEYYHPDTGASLSHRGFMDWNLLVLEMLA